MTCVSLRWGSGSSGTVWGDPQPATAPARVTRTTAARCRADRSMIRAIIGLHPAFRVEEERAGERDALARLEPVHDGDAVAVTAADLHVARLEHPGAALDEHVRAEAREHDRGGRDPERRFVGD